MADKTVSIELTATSSQLTAETGKAAAATKGLANEAKQCGISIGSSFTSAESQSTQSLKKMGGDVDTYKNKLHELKEIGGRRSALGETAELLRGAGALAGITILGDELKKTTDKAVELNKEFREGKTDAMGLGVGIAEALPIIGGFVSAGQGIRELFTHEKEQLDGINAEIKTGNELMEQRVKTQQDVIKGNEDIAEKLRKANQELALANAKTPEQRQKLESQFKVDDQKHDNDKDQEEFAKKRQDDLKIEIDLIRKGGEERKKIAEAAADSKISRYDGDSDEENDQLRADAKRKADFDADSVTGQALKAAQDRAKNDVDAHKKGLDQISELDKQAAAKKLANEKADAAGKADEKFIKESGKDIEDWVKEKAHALEEYNKAVEKTAAEEKKHAEEEKKQIQELKAEVSALNSGGDASAAKVATDNPELAKWQAIKDEIIKRNELLKEAETPMDKFKSQLEEIQKMQKDGLLTQEQANKLADKDAKDFKEAQNREAKKDQDKDAVASVTGERRFSFDIQSRGNDEKLKTAKDHFEEAKRQGNYLMQLWQKITQGDPTLAALNLLAS